jgi:fructoselysine-6-P-deglycase FrlB-like protein
MSSSCRQNERTHPSPPLEGDSQRWSKPNVTAPEARAASATPHMATELASQPETWARAAELREEQARLPKAGARVAVVGCGTSWFMAQSYACLRESRGQGETDSFTASEALVDRRYDAVVAITRSGTTTEVLELVERLRGRVPTIGIVGDPTSPLGELVDDAVAMPFADERSVVQTRFATTALAFLRASLGEDLHSAVADADRALAEDLDPDLVAAEQFTFLGRGWTVGLAHEAALKMRESAQSWTESYPAMEYRHGPISIAAPGRVTWYLGEPPAGLATEVGATGARFEAGTLDPMAELVRAQRVALARAQESGLDPDSPRNLTRSVILTST